MASLCNVWVNDLSRCSLQRQFILLKKIDFGESIHFFNTKTQKTFGPFFMLAATRYIQNSSFLFTHSIPMEQREVGTLIIRQFLNSIFCQQFRQIDKSAYTAKGTCTPERPERTFLHEKQQKKNAHTHTHTHTHTHKTKQYENKRC